MSFENFSFSGPPELTRDELREMISQGLEQAGVSDDPSVVELNMSIVDHVFWLLDSPETVTQQQYEDIREEAHRFASLKKRGKLN